MKDNTILERIAREAQEALGENLVSLVLYGSHARGEAGPGSNINLFVLVRDHSAQAIMPLRKLAVPWAKLAVMPPVIFRADQMARSFDTFSLEFLEIAAARKVLIGEDPFLQFSPDWTAVRSEIEREARQKRIALTRRWLLSAGDAKAVQTIIADTVPGYLTLLRCAVMLQKRAALSLRADEVIEEMRAYPWFDADAWRMLRAVSKREQKVSGAELEALAGRYLDQAIALVKGIDEIEMRSEK